MSKHGRIQKKKLFTSVMKNNVVSNRMASVQLVRLVIPVSKFHMKLVGVGYKFSMTEAHIRS